MHPPLALLFGRAPRRAAGFTLVELMVVVALLGILLGLAAPSFSGALQRQRERSTAQELHDALELGRAEAIRLGRPVVVRRIEPCAGNIVGGMWQCGCPRSPDSCANGGLNRW
ncbi:Tfp pilus assembly protein FimT/FimU [Hydrogenophaga sp. XSHU_21]